MVLGLADEVLEGSAVAASVVEEGFLFFLAVGEEVAGYTGGDVGKLGEFVGSCPGLAGGLSHGFNCFRGHSRSFLGGLWQKLTILLEDMATGFDAGPHEPF